MRGMMITLSAAAAAIAMGAGYAQSALLPDMDYEYSGDAMPQSSSPAWQSFFTGDASVSGGILTVTTPGVNNIGSPADPNSKEFRLDGGTGQPWGPQGAGTTVEVRLKTDYDVVEDTWAGSLLIDTGSKSWGMMFGEGFITDKLGGGDFAITTDDAFHTYRFVVSNEASGNLDLYVDGNTTPAHSWAGAGSGASRFSFGDLFSESRGQVQWDYIQWTNDGAFAPVPEPSSALALAAFGLLGLRRSRRAGA